jgi:hypothetical protein
MTQESFKFFVLACVAVLFFSGIEGCAPTKSKYDREYDRVWDEIVQSEAWTNALLVSNSNSKAYKKQEFGTLSNKASFSMPTSPDTDREQRFKDKYHTLVTRAYFKIIAEAQKADGRLRSEQDKWNEQFLADQPIRSGITINRRALINRKYDAHRKMLEGLLSWNIFSEERTADLEFFKAENFDRAYRMAANGEDEGTIIEFLEYRLADLYHRVD